MSDSPSVPSIDQYLAAATRANTRRSYASAIRHFEVEWGGHLPATPDSVARYLADYAEQHAINTLRQRLAALANWHIEQGFVDPTRSPLVRKVRRGIKAPHPVQSVAAERPVSRRSRATVLRVSTGGVTRALA
jgi:hypothetical protein